MPLETEPSSFVVVAAQGCRPVSDPRTDDPEGPRRRDPAAQGLVRRSHQGAARAHRPVAADAQRLRARRGRGRAEVRQGRRPRARRAARRKARCTACRSPTRTCTTRKGKLAECGSKIRKGWIAPATATAVERLEAAGAFRLGALQHGRVRLRADRAQRPYSATSAIRGTRSASPAARRPAPASAVAARLVPAALGSDTGGSIRLPAHFCGVTGFKPTNGRVSRANAMPLSFTLDTVGPLAQTAEDCATDPVDHRRARSARSDHRAARRTGTRKRRQALAEGPDHRHAERASMSTISKPTSPRRSTTRSRRSRSSACKIVKVDLPDQVMVVGRRA